MGRPSRTQTETARQAPRCRSRSSTPVARTTALFRAARAGGTARLTGCGLPLDLLPGLRPTRVVSAIGLTVAAVGDRGLPELDAVEVSRRGPAVVQRGRPLRQLVHLGARLRVRGRLT